MDADRIYADVAFGFCADCFERCQLERRLGFSPAYPENITCAELKPSLLRIITVQTEYLKNISTLFRFKIHSF